MFISARMLRTATIACFSPRYQPVRLHQPEMHRTAGTVQHDGVGSDTAKYFHTLPDGLVMNGMIGCARRSRPSSTVTTYGEYRAVRLLFHRSLPAWSLQIPVTELVPGELIQNACGESKRKLSSASRYALMVWLNSAESSGPPAIASFRRR